MKWGIDAAFMPPRETVGAMKYAGWEFMCGYIGGRAEHVWSPGDWRFAHDSGLQLLPIYVAPLVDDQGREVGTNHGNDAIGRMQAFGFTGTLALDVENGLTPREYCTGFLDACAAGDVGVVVYGNPKTIDGIGDLPWLGWWLADWAPLLLPPNLAPPDWSMWQVQASQSVDVNVAVDEFPFAGFQPG